MAYAKRLTKERLIQEGFTEITKEGRLFKGDREVFPHWNSGREGNKYLCITLYLRDSEGHLIKGYDCSHKYTLKDGTIRESKNWAAKSETIGLHRAMYAWHYGVVPEGYVVDHINNKHSRIEDYNLDNLQLLTPKENTTKERICNIWELKCKLNKPRKFYEDKLAKYETLYEEAKANKDADKAHKLRTNLTYTRAKLRYYDAHIEEANQKIKDAKDLELLKYLKDEYRKSGDKQRWHMYNDIIKNWKDYDSNVKEQIMQCALGKIGNFGGNN